MLNAAFPTVTIQFERVGDDPFHIGVAVFGVESNAIKWVKDKILDIDEKICANSEFAITPLVRDEATTEKYYHELMSPWNVCHTPKGVAFSRQFQTGIDVGALVLQESSSVGKWEYPEPVSASAANQELALAA